MNALKTSLRTLVALITVLVCLGDLQGFAQVSEELLIRFRKLAEQGNAGAQSILGRGYFTSEGVPQDYAEAVKWYRMAAKQGDAVAQAAVALMHYSGGKGVPQDYAKAAKWYRKAAEQGSATAQYSLGWCYAEGEGVPKDDVLAYMWLNLAAASGNEDAKTSRETVSKRMTAEQIAEAQKLSREWMQKNQ